MSLISKKSIDEIRSRADIVAFIGDYTDLRRAGSKWRGLSPFADEKTPSFFVDPEKGFYYCFSTGQGGDIFKFLMARENLTFAESVERVAKRFGVAVEYEKGARAERSRRGELFELHELAATYFREQFNGTGGGGNASQSASVREYWTRERRFSAETAAHFRIGFLPPGGSRALVEVLLRKGFGAKTLATAGIFVGTERAPNDPLRWLSRFESRLIIPILDIQKRVIAFTARKIPGITPEDSRGMNEAKYINSSETEIFHKGSTLFNIDKAKDVFVGRRSSGNASGPATGTAEALPPPFVLVEGQLDAIRCWECGIRTAVAGQGTGITAEQLQLLRRYSTRLDCLLDADAAGQKAALRLAPIAFKVGLDLRFLSVPGGKDPDEFLSRNGTGGVPAILESAVPAMQFVARRFFPARERLSPAQTQRAMDEIFSMLAESSSAVFHADCLHTLARVAGLDRLAVERDFSRFLVQKKAEARSREGAVSRGALPRPMSVAPEAPHPLTTVEEDVLILVLNYDDVTPLFANTIPPHWLNSETCAGRVLNRIFAESQEGEWLGSESIHDLLEGEEEYALVARIRNDVAREKIEDPQRVANECLAALCRRNCERERREIDDHLATLAPESEEFLGWQKRRIELRKILKNPPKIQWTPNKEN